MPQVGLQQGETRRFLGVNLRQDRLDLQDDQLAKAINADLHTVLGTAVLRLGRTKQYTTALADLVVRRIAKVNAVRYRVAGQSVYRDSTVILDGTLSTNLFTTMVAMRPVDDTVVSVFIADDSVMKRDDGTTVSGWGIAAPTTIGVAGLGTGALVGAYSFKYTYVRYTTTSIVVHESNPTAATADVTAATQGCAIGEMVSSSDAQVNGIAVYRTAAGGASWLLERRMEIPTAPTYTVFQPWEATSAQDALLRQVGSPVTYESVAYRRTQTWEVDGAGDGEDTNGYVATYLWEEALYVTTQTSYWAFGSDTADEALGSAVDDDNDLPPNAEWAVEHQGHIFLTRDDSVPERLYWTKRWDPESVPSTNFLDIGTADDPLQCAVPIAGLLGVFGRKTKYRVVGNTTSGFVYTEALSKRGTPAPLATIGTERGIIFPARDGIFITNVVSVDEMISEAIQPLFFGETVNEMLPINWSAIQTASAAMYKNRYYFSYPETGNTQPNRTAVFSFETQKWYHYDTPARSLYVEEDIDALTSGFTDGFVYVLEDGTDDAGTDIAMDVETKDYWGESTTTRKFFQFFKVDIDCLTATTVAAAFYVDGVLKRTVTLSGTRTKKLLPLPEDTVGFSWRIKLTYTGSQRIKAYGVSAIYLPLSAA